MIIISFLQTLPCLLNPSRLRLVHFVSHRPNIQSITCCNGVNELLPRHRRRSAYVGILGSPASSAGNGLSHSPGSADPLWTALVNIAYPSSSPIL
jgi:hypothetical protein